MSEIYINYLGYIVSLLVVVSFFFYNQSILRTFSLAGCILFTIYGLLIDSIPIIITNIFIVVLQIRYFAFKFFANDNK